MAGARHPTARTFWGVGAVLFVLTAIEVAIIELQGMRPLVVALLFGLAAAKFYLVASYFMHLRFDHRLLGWTFGVGLLFAVLITVSQKLISVY